MKRIKFTKTNLEKIPHPTGKTPVDDGSVEINLSYYKEKSVIDIHPNFDENKFPKVAEAIWKARRGDKN